MVLSVLERLVPVASGWAVLLIALTAIYWPSLGGLERDLALLTAV